MDNMTSDRTVLVCLGRCCRKDGSKAVLTRFQSQATPEVEIIPSGCLGKCGNGPNVLVLPEKIWCQQVRPKDVPSILFGSSRRTKNPPSC